MHTDEALGSHQRTRESNQIEAGGAGGDNRPRSRVRLFQLPIDRLLGLDVLGRKFDGQLRDLVIELFETRDCFHPARQVRQRIRAPAEDARAKARRGECRCHSAAHDAVTADENGTDRRRSGRMHVSTVAASSLVTALSCMVTSVVLGSA